MCGIAGYNASPSWVGKYLTEEKQYDLLRQAWLHNQHRGRDAAGYMRVDAEDNQAYMRKAAMPASQILEANAGEPRISPALVFAAHTRAATLGKPDDPRNNHPVEYQHLLVTHNGTITNHKEFKDRVPKDLKDQLGEVDSGAIAVALNEVHDPHDVNMLLKTLPKLQGGMAIHAIWKQFPGVSVFARGKSSPMFFRHHQEGFFCYASVDEANFAMIEAMGLDPNDDGWTIRKMDEYSLVVVEYGQPVGWGSYRTAGWVNNQQKLPHFVRRIFNGTPVFQSDMRTFWASKPSSRSLTAAKEAKEAKLIYTQDQGFLTAAQYPTKDTVKAYDKVVEADQVFEHTKEDVLYALYGSVEVLVDSRNSRLLDVYDHSKSVKPRHDELPKQTPVETKVDYETWLNRFTTKVQPVKHATTPQFQRGGARTTNPPQGGITMLVPPKKVDQCQNLSQTGKRVSGSTSRTGTTDLFEVGWDITWEDHGSYKHSRHSQMWWLHDVKCDQHGVKYSDHTKPEECAAAVQAAIVFASAVNDITLWYDLALGIEIHSRVPKNEHGLRESCDSQTDKKCTYMPYLWREVYLETVETTDLVVHVLMGEQCTQCGARMFINKLPDWMERWTDDKVWIT